MKELSRYLMDNLCLDFQGSLGLDEVREFLRKDDSREARNLLSKIIQDKNIDDLLVTVADILKDHLRTGVNEDIVRDQLLGYSES